MNDLFEPTTVIYDPRAKKLNEGLHSHPKVCKTAHLFEKQLGLKVCEFGNEQITH